jgi:beta-lactamase class A
MVRIPRLTTSHPRIMLYSRRLFIAAAMGAGLAGCARRDALPAAATVFDSAVLDAGFPGLAARARPAEFALGVAPLNADKAWVSSANRRFPMQSVFKAPLAAAALAGVDAGSLKLGEAITLTEADLSPHVSAINDIWPTPPEGHTLTLPAIDLIALAVQRGDNTAADTIMKRLGGPAQITAWLRSKGVDGISIDRYERELQQDVAGMPPFQPAWKDDKAWMAARNALSAIDRESATASYLSDPRDTSTVPAALNFLITLAQGDLLSATSTRLLLRLMTDTIPGARRLKAGLPAGASIAHRPGSASTDLGLTPATNDIGVVTLADGRRFAIAGFLAGSTATEVARDRLFADAAALACRAMS